MSTVTQGETAMLGVSAITVRMGIEAHLKFKGQLRLTRTATPTNLLAWATRFTGKTYKKSPKGMTQALADLNRVIENKNLAEVGQVAVVNQLVGGVAADLA
jgi:hypothetical protein